MVHGKINNTLNLIKKHMFFQKTVPNNNDICQYWHTGHHLIDRITLTIFIGIIQGSTFLLLLLGFLGLPTAIITFVLNISQGYGPGGLISISFSPYPACDMNILRHNGYSSPVYCFYYTVTK